ncbi:hypothetical protein CAPTEDRAFT_130893, partial [Capitella teleta]
QVCTDNKKYKCSWPDCTKAFHAPSLLKRHFSTHTGEKAFKCPFCPHASTQKCHLMGHIRLIHAKQI